MEPYYLHDLIDVTQDLMLALVITSWFYILGRLIRTRSDIIGKKFYFLICGITLLAAGSWLEFVPNFVDTPPWFDELRTFFYAFGALFFTVGIVSWVKLTMALILRLEDAAYLDPLTGCYSRLGIEKILADIELRKSAVTLIVADLNGLKPINDRYGHQAGDQYLITTTQVLAESFPPGSSVGRMGGDEFLIIVPETNAQILNAILDQVSKKIGNLEIAEDTGISLGYATLPGDGDTWEEVFNLADQRMYQQKIKSGAL